MGLHKHLAIILSCLFTFDGNADECTSICTLSFYVPVLLWVKEPGLSSGELCFKITSQEIRYNMWGLCSGPMHFLFFKKSSSFLAGRCFPDGQFIGKWGEGVKDLTGNT